MSDCAVLRSGSRAAMPLMSGSTALPPRQYRTGSIPCPCACPPWLHGSTARGSDSTVGASGSTALCVAVLVGNGWIVPYHYKRGSSSPKLTYLFPQKLHCCSKLHFRPISLPSQSNLLICSGLVEKAPIYTSTKRNLIPPTNPLRILLLLGV